MDGAKEIVAVSSDRSIALVADLADEIWREHYTPIIGLDQVEYMLDKFQSATAISKQIEEGALYYLIFSNKAAVGYFSIYLKESTLFLSKVYVRSSLRGKGLGKKSIQFIEKMALENELESISLTVNKNNSRSIQAYKKMGFEIIKPVVMEIGDGFVMDDFYMEKKL